MAKRFQFNLQAVERMRKQALDVERRALADRVRAWSAVRDQLENIRRAQRETSDLLRATRSGDALDVTAVRTQQLYGGWLATSAVAMSQRVAEEQRSLEAQRARVAEATKALRVIEKLKERALAKFRAEIARQERIEMDEIASQMFERKRREGEALPC